MKKVLFIVTVLLLVAAFGVSAFLVGNYVVEGKQEDDRNQQIANMVTQGTTAAPTVPAETTEAETTVPPTTEETEPQILDAYKDVYAQNDHTVGWIRIDGTKVNYPVLQTPEEPNYYLKRNFDRKASDWGAIYAREVCDINEPSDNITLYGHNMADGSMFAVLHSYQNKKTWENNSLIFFDTLYEYHTYKIFAVFKTSANLGEGFSYHQFVDAENEEEFNEFVKTCKDLSFYETGETPKYGDKIICLSTCEYTMGNGNGRLVVAAYRIS